MGGVISEFQKVFPKINLDLLKNEIKYDRAIITFHLNELDNGFLVKK